MPDHRSTALATQRRVPRTADDEVALTAEIVELATRYGRYGYRRIAALLRDAGWNVNRKRVERIWRREGLKVPQKQPKRGRLWLSDGSCIRLRAEHSNHVWAYDFVEDRTHDGRKFRLLCLVDEFTRECLAIRVARRLGSLDVIETLADLCVKRGAPDHIRSDQGPEFIALAVREWIGAGRAAGHCSPGTEHAITLTLQLDPSSGAGHKSGPATNFVERYCKREPKYGGCAPPGAAAGPGNPRRDSESCGIRAV